MFSTIPSSVQILGKISASPTPLDQQGLTEQSRQLWGGNLSFPVCWLSLELGKECGTGGAEG